MSASMAELLAGHWSRSTFTNHEPHVDKCDGCGAVIYTWGGDPMPGGVEPLAAHQAEVLAANGYGKLEDAWDLGAEMAIQREHTYGADEKAKYNNPYRRIE